jgi:transcriptional regulator with XRE-family HTH domain
MEILEQIGENLVTLRKEAGLSQEELAFRAGVHRTHISLIERGERTPRLDTLAKLADGLGVRLATLLRGIG